MGPENLQVRQDKRKGGQSDKKGTERVTKRDREREGVLVKRVSKTEKEKEREREGER